MNIYIDQGILEDCHNDRNVLMGLSAKITEAIKEAGKLKDAGALAFNDEVLDSVIEKLDDVLWHSIRPIEELADEGERHHEQRNVA